jgi:hypothetical protein
VSAGPIAGPRTWVGGDNEPADRPNLYDAYGHWWWHNGHGWRSSQLGYTEDDKTWWWLTMYRGPLKEDTR